MINELTSVFGVIADQLPGALLGGMGTLTAVYSVRAYKDAVINKAIAENDVGVRFANVTYATYQWSKGENPQCTQRLWAYDSKFDLTKVFNGKAQTRYLEYLDTAAELARQSENNPYVFDYIEEAIKLCERKPTRRVLSLITGKPDTKKIKASMMRDITTGLGRDIGVNGHGFPRLFDGVDFKKNGTRIYPVMVAEKNAEHKQVKILLLREHDLIGQNIAVNAGEVAVYHGDQKYSHDSKHPHMLRWQTNRKFADRINADSKFKNEVAVRVIIPPVLRSLGADGRREAGIIPAVA